MGRAMRDASFRPSLLSDPVAATAGYNLTREQLDELQGKILVLGGGGAGKPDHRPCDKMANNIMGGDPMRRKLTVLTMMAALLFSVLPCFTPVARAASDPSTFTFDISEGNITVAAGTDAGALNVTYGSSQTTTADFSYIQVITIIDSSSATSSTANTITINCSTPAVPEVNIILDSVNIDTFGSGGCAFSILPDSPVNLILLGKNTLTGGLNYAGLSVPDGATLFITSASIGSLTATGYNSAGIGGGGNGGGGTVTISGGTVTATGVDGAGIGGGNGGGGGGTVNISGGTVTATGDMGAGIGGGCFNGNGGTVNISGGTVKATGEEGDSEVSGAGIGGGGNGGNGGTVNISGGTVTASSVFRGSLSGGGAGIGGGNDGGGGMVTISGGTVTATGVEGGAGIGGGYKGSGGMVTISGGTVTASSVFGTSSVTTNFEGGAGIGGGIDSSGGTVAISGGTVTATGGQGGAGIGGTVTIDGGSVNASGMQPLVYSTPGQEEYLAMITGLPVSTAVSYTVYGSRPVSCSTDTSGQLYLWLPAPGSATSILITAGSTYYEATGTVSATASNTFATSLASLPVTISTTNLPIGIIGAAYSSGALSAQYGTGSCTWNASGLPSGLSIGSSTGIISGTPEQTGSFSVEVTACDADDNKATAAFNLAVEDSVGLTGLSVSKGALTPDFNSNLAAYQVSMASSASSLSVTAVVYDPLAGLAIDGQAASSGVAQNVYLSQGANLIPVVITYGDMQKAYIISVNGTVSDANLSALQVNGTTVASFSPDTTSYNLGSVGSSQSSITLTASPDDSKAMLLQDGGLLTAGSPTAVNLAYGANTIQVMVVAENASTKTYIIDITRGMPSITWGAGSLQASDITATGLTLTWPPASSAAGISGYDIYQGATLLSTVAGSVYSYNVAGLTQGASYAFSVQALDSSGNQSTPLTLSPSTNSGISITTNLPAATVNTSYSGSLTANGGTGSYIWQVPDLPEGLTLGANGSISGTPTVIGSTAVTATVYDSSGQSAALNFSFRVNPAALSITTTSLTGATVNTSYSATLTASGGKTPYNWSATGLPNNLTIDSSTGAINGTPTVTGTYMVNVTLTDSSGLTASEGFTMNVFYPTGTGKYTINPVSDQDYTIGTTTQGIATMTVNSGTSGFTYFTVNVAVVVSHGGNEVVVIKQMRNGTQIAINATKADFDQVSSAVASFNVNPGDVIEAYIVDNLSNSADSNPALLQ